ncbi:MAG: ribulose-phosphate 3-epimerase [Bdellovibrionales bacterium]|nr:ribulose-phosphate 3-epimerase [Bdellovibrionales bacterium]
MIIAPSILSADFGHLEEEIQAVEKAGADWIHVDVMDGHFVPNITLGPVVVEGIRKCTNLPIDVHLMIESPERYIKAFKDAGADLISVHVEACTHLQRTLALIKEAGAKPGVVLNPATSLYALDYIWQDIEMILLMTVNPGFGGQVFIPSMMEKIRTARKKADRENPNIHIQVDGGVQASNILDLKKAGANVFVSGSAIFNSDNYEMTIKTMKTNLDQ